MKTTNREWNSGQELREHWVLLLVLGIALVFLGFMAIRLAFLTTIATFTFLGSLLAMGGILELIDAIRTRKSTGFMMKFLGALLTLAIGVSILLRPMVGAAALTLLIGIFFVAVGSLRATAALIARFEQWGWYVLSGVVGFAFGLYILMQWPVSSLWVIGLFFGVDLIVFGWSTVMLALGARRSPQSEPVVRV